MFQKLQVKREKFGIKLFIITFLVGIIFFSSGLHILKNSKIDESWIRTSGKIVDVVLSNNQGSTMYSPVIKYEVGENSYQINDNFASTLKPNIGENKSVAYNKDRPEEGKVVGGVFQKFFPWIFIISGIFLTIFSIKSFIASTIRSRQIKSLMGSGQKLQGVLTEVMKLGSDKNTYKVTVSAIDQSGTVNNYLSDTISGGIGGLAMADFQKNPIPIDVYVNHSNPKDYYVDTSDLPNLTPERMKELLGKITKQE